MEIRVFFVALLLVASPFLQSAICQSESQDEGVGTDRSVDVQIVNETDETPIFGDENFSPATGVETVCVFPKNIAKLVSAGEETELLVGIKYDVTGCLLCYAVSATVCLQPVFNNASVPPSAQATFPYIFVVSKFLQKSKRAPKVEVGTRSTDASLDEWLEGTAYGQSQSNKSKKKK